VADLFYKGLYKGKAFKQGEVGFIAGQVTLQSNLTIINTALTHKWRGKLIAAAKLY
jgi:hypothetical protein